MKNRRAPDWLTARPIAHRGLHDFPRGIVENSLGAARAALARGYAIECDLRLSRDGVIFVFHDDDLARLTGEAGAFSARTAAEIAAIPLRCGVPIPTLAAFLAEVDGTTPLILELKSDFSGDITLAEALAVRLGDYAGPVAVKSFDPALIAALRATAAPWPLGIVAQAEVDEAEFARLGATQRLSLTRLTHLKHTRPDFLSWRAADLPNPVCELARACAAMPVMTWTIRSSEQAAAARKHADQMVFEGFLA